MTKEISKIILWCVIATLFIVLGMQLFKLKLNSIIKEKEAIGEQVYPHQYSFDKVSYYEVPVSSYSFDTVYEKGVAIKGTSVEIRSGKVYGHLSILKKHVKVKNIIIVVEDTNEQK